MQKRVLVIDDEAHARAIGVGLRLEGFDVHAVATAEAALGLLAEFAFDAAVVDLMMPRTNALELARLVRERHPGTRVVLTGAYHLSERQLVNTDCGAVGFVSKPLEMSELARLLAAQCSGSKRSSGGASSSSS